MIRISDLLYFVVFKGMVSTNRNIADIPDMSYDQSLHLFALTVQERMINTQIK